MTTEAQDIEVDKTVPQDAGAFLSQQNGEALTALLDKMEQTALTQRDKGTRFERLSIDYFTKDKKFQGVFTKVQTYADWAKEYPNLAEDGQDVGIDLVATNSSTFEDVVSIGGGYNVFKSGLSS